VYHSFHIFKSQVKGVESCSLPGQLKKMIGASSLNNGRGGKGVKDSRSRECDCLNKTGVEFPKGFVKIFNVKEVQSKGRRLASKKVFLLEKTVVTQPELTENIESMATDQKLKIKIGKLLPEGGLAASKPLTERGKVECTRSRQKSRRTISVIKNKRQRLLWWRR